MEFHLSEFFSDPGKGVRPFSRHLLPKNNGKTTGYRQNRFRIANLNFRGRKSRIVVLDEIAKLTPPKLELIRYLAMAKRFQFVAVVEIFLKADQLSLLRGWLHPALLLDIGYLGEQPAREFFRYYSRKNHFCWTEGEINNLAEMSGGYPLGMKEIVMRRLEREESKSFRQGCQGGLSSKRGAASAGGKARSLERRPRIWYKEGENREI